jgi:hypothetical protein
MIEPNVQLALLCARCSELLVTVTEQAVQQCISCLAAPDDATATTSLPSPHTPTVRPSSSTPTPDQKPAPSRLRRRRPNWIYESSRDDLLSLFAIFTRLFGQPFEDSWLDDPHTFREAQHLYVTFVDRYFDADAPYGVSRAGLVRWIEETWLPQAQQEWSRRWNGLPRWRPNTGM